VAHPSNGFSKPHPWNLVGFSVGRRVGSDVVGRAVGRLVGSAVVVHTVGRMVGRFVGSGVIYVADGSGVK